jgi:hypothetical protein
LSEYDVTEGKEIDFRLDLVNVGKNSGLLVRIENLIPKDFQIMASPAQYKIENNSIDMKGKSLGPLKVESITLRLKTSKPGSFKLSSKVIYVDETGSFKTLKLEPSDIIVQPKSSFKFKTKAATNVFDYLLQSFIEDYMRKRIVLEKSGWRTLMEIVKQGKVSKSNMYGSRGRRGRTVEELERRGLIETRIFPGERGRGGRIRRLRIAYNKDPIKRYIDQKIMNV